MKWRDLTSEQLDSLAIGLFDQAREMEVDREDLRREEGFDYVAAVRTVARRLQREAKRRERKGSSPAEKTAGAPGERVYELDVTSDVLADAYAQMGNGDPDEEA